MLQLKYKEYTLNIPSLVYSPSEDTFLLIDVLKKEIKNKEKSFLEIGFGSGVITLEFYNFFERIVAVDIDKEVVNYFLKVKEEFDLKKLEAKHSNLFSSLEEESFDVIVFNPPYVPSKKIEIPSTDGGKEGGVVIKRFIGSLKKHLNKKGRAYLLLSSHNNLKKIYSLITKEGFSFKVLGEQNIFFEKLIVIMIGDF